jgi:hypothetical protein
MYRLFYNNESVQQQSETFCKITGINFKQVWLIKYNICWIMEKGQ